MATKLYLAQRTSRHVAKRLDASSIFELIFGTWGTAKTDTTGFSYPWGLAADPATDNIFVCDGNNERIIKLDKDLTYISEVDVSASIGRPHTIFFESGSGDFYIAGIKDYLTLSIGRMTTALSVTKSESNIYPADTNDQPMGISADFSAGFFLISGMNDLLKVEETGGGFNTATTQAITGEAGTKFLGNVIHTNGDLYLLSNRFNGSSLSRVNSSYVNIGDSNKISRSTATLTEGLGGNLLFVDNQGDKVVKYDVNLNFVADVYTQPASPPSGFIVVPGANLLDFDEGLGPISVATVPPGIYPTLGALEAAVKFALDTSAPPTPNTYTVTDGTFGPPGIMEIIQDPAGSGIFNIFPATMPVSGFPVSVGPTIGFLADQIQPGPGLPPGVPPGPPIVGDVPVPVTPFPPEIFDAKEIYGIAEIDV